jgi:phosphoribosylformylglycinamidine cyclo-ligase
MSAYKDAGVDIEAGEEAVKNIKNIVESTWNNRHGRVFRAGFLGVAVEMPDGTIKTDSTDSAGTKTKIAALLNKHDTVGIDAVAMAVNDLVVGGMTVEYCVDSILMSKQIPSRTEQIVTGVAEGCRRARCYLTNGEMAELGNTVPPDWYEVLVTAHGVAPSRDHLITCERICPGMQVFGYPSSGVHSNGFSLIRKVFGLNRSPGDLAIPILKGYQDDLEGNSLGEELLTPTMVYTDVVKIIRDLFDVAGLAHITGGGIVGKVGSILPKDCCAKIYANRWERQPIFDLIQSVGKLYTADMFETFNCGLGLVAISGDDLSRMESGWIHIGEVQKRRKRQ